MCKLAIGMACKQKGGPKDRLFVRADLRRILVAAWHQLVMAGRVPAIPIHLSLPYPHKRDRRHKAGDEVL
jgi:hypothetical protein